MPALALHSQDLPRYSTPTSLLGDLDCVGFLQVDSDILALYHTTHIQLDYKPIVVMCALILGRARIQEANRTTQQSYLLAAAQGHGFT